MIKKNTNTNLTIDALKQGRITLRMIGNTPIIFNRMAEKAKRDLLIGFAMFFIMGSCFCVTVAVLESLG